MSKAGKAKSERMARAMRCEPLKSNHEKKLDYYFWRQEFGWKGNNRWKQWWMAESKWGEKE